MENGSAGVVLQTGFGACMCEALLHVVLLKMGVSGEKGKSKFGVKKGKASFG